jgi:hypothetical protein
MLMSMAAWVKPKKKSARKRVTPLGARASKGRTRQFESAATVTTRWLPSLEMAQPVMGIATINPTGTPKSTSPSSPASRPSLSLMAGIRDTQAANTKPQTKKVT